MKVGSRVCTERKVPFATAGRVDQNGFWEYVEDLKLLIAVQGSRGVSEFFGVVLNDTRTQLRSYMYEYPSLGDVFAMLLSARRKGETMPLFIRLAWSSQILQAVADVHGRAFAVGSSFILQSFGIRADGSIILLKLSSSPRDVWGAYGLGADGKAGAGLRAEVFFLGRKLWMLGSNLFNWTVAANILCLKADCTAKPRYTCKAHHRDPFELPSCFDSVPHYFDDIIRLSRSPDPKERPSASALAEVMSDNCHARIQPVHVETILMRYAALPRMGVRCDECGTNDMDPHFHCTVCQEANFDLCQDCVGQGIHCWEPSHDLLKRVFKDGSFIHVEESM